MKIVKKTFYSSVIFVNPNKETLCRLKAVFIRKFSSFFLQLKKLHKMSYSLVSTNLEFILIHGYGNEIRTLTDANYLA